MSVTVIYTLMFDVATDTTQALPDQISDAIKESSKAFEMKAREGVALTGAYARTTIES